MRCFIEMDASGPTALLRGRVVSGEGGSGEYRLVVTVAGPSGTSNLNQGGAFTALPNQDATVGRVGFNTEGGRSFEAVLTATLGGRTVTCRRTGP